MSSLSNILGFEKFNAKAMWKQIREDPERLLLGAFDPASTKLWGTILHKDWKDQPIVDQWGGASNYNYGRAEKEGIPTDAARNMHKVARAIASYFVGGYAADKLGAAGNGGGGGGWQDYVKQMPSPQQQQPQSDWDYRMGREYGGNEPIPQFNDDQKAMLQEKANMLRARIAELKGRLGMENG